MECLTRDKKEWAKVNVESEQISKRKEHAWVRANVLAWLRDVPKDLLLLFFCVLGSIARSKKEKARGDVHRIDEVRSRKKAYVHSYHTEDCCLFQDQ